MRIKIDRQEALDRFTLFEQANGIPENYFQDLDTTALGFRKALLGFWSEAKKEKGEYQKDLSFALNIYEYFKEEVEPVTLEDSEFWFYICCVVVPDIVYERRGLAKEYFFFKPGRVYLQALWQYVHMTYQGDKEATKEALKHFNTDYIVQFSERTGRAGYYLEVYRQIAKYLAILPVDILNKSINGANLCRRVMIQNTAYSESFDLVFEKETNQYVKMLFKACGVEVEQYEERNAY